MTFILQLCSHIWVYACEIWNPYLAKDCQMNESIQSLQAGCA